MKNYFKQNWFSVVLALLLFLSFLYDTFNVLQVSFSGAPDIVVKFYRIESSISLLIFISFLSLFSISEFSKNKNNYSRAKINVDKLYPNLATHQKRVIVERYELDDKHFNLMHFIHNNDTYKSLDRIDQLALKEQLAHMTAYLEVLNKRISRF